MPQSLGGNPFGLVDSRVLAQMRANQRRIDARVRQNKLSGVNFASSELGNAIGRLVGAGLGKAGIIKDPQKLRAEQVDEAQRRAIENTDVPEDANPIDLDIAQRTSLARELHNAGLFGESARVAGSIFDLRKQKTELSRMQSEEIKSRVEAENLEADQNDAQARARLLTTRESAETDVMLVNRDFALPMARVDLATALQSFEQNKKLNPLTVGIAKADLAVRQAEELVGGTVPTFARLLNERDHVITHLAQNPTDQFAAQRLEFLNSKLQTEALGVQRNVDNYDPTNAALTSIQTQIAELDSAQDEIQDLVDALNRPGEALGEIPEFRIKAANILSQILPLAGFPQSVTSDVTEFIAPTAGVLEPQALARKLRVSLLPLIKKNNRTTPQDVELIEDLIQATESATSERAALVALMQTSQFIASRQKVNFSILEGGFRRLIPGLGISTPEAAPNGPLNAGEVGDLLEAAGRRRAQ